MKFIEQVQEALKSTTLAKVDGLPYFANTADERCIHRIEDISQLDTFLQTHKVISIVQGASILTVATSVAPVSRNKEFIDSVSADRILNVYSLSKPAAPLLLIRDGAVVGCVAPGTPYIKKVQQGEVVSFTLETA